MSTLDRSDVARLAALARIDMTDDDLDRLSGQLAAIVDAVALVSEVAGEDVPATSHPIPMANVHRPDEVRPSLSQEAALSGAPEAEDGRFRVPQILGEEA
jgi:aspartyl-tRNA(Asn)/glutamyl-tRNA(Gln) amidotransferase subunit C